MSKDPDEPFFEQIRNLGQAARDGEGLDPTSDSYNEAASRAAEAADKLREMGHGG